MRDGVRWQLPVGKQEETQPTWRRYVGAPAGAAVQAHTCGGGDTLHRRNNKRTMRLRGCGASRCGKTRCDFTGAWDWWPGTALLAGAPALHVLRGLLNPMCKPGASGT
eukprot:XP_001694847.1 predicted protein [Chlamydomonas reinhardtii]